MNDKLLCEICCKSPDIIKKECKKSCDDCNPAPAPALNDDPTPDENDCLSKATVPGGEYGKEHRWLMGPWNATNGGQLSGEFFANVLFEYAPEYICKKLTDPVTNKPYNNYDLIYYYFRIYGNPNINILDNYVKMDVDTNWLGPFLCRIINKGEKQTICLLVDDPIPTFRDESGFSLLPEFIPTDVNSKEPVGSTKNPGFTPESEEGSDDYLRKGTMNIQINYKYIGSGGEQTASGPLHYSDLYTMKYWGCEIDKPNNTLTFTLSAPFMSKNDRLKQLGTLVATSENQGCQDWGNPISSCYPKSTYSNSNQCVNTVCPVPNTGQWKINFIILLVISLIILLILSFILLFKRKK